MLRLLSRFLRALFQFSKRAAGEATKFGRSGVKLLGVVGAARLECGEPAAESGELIRRQLGNSFGDFFEFYGAQLTSSEFVVLGFCWLCSLAINTNETLSCARRSRSVPRKARRRIRIAKALGIDRHTAAKYAVGFVPRTLRTRAR